MQLTVCCQDQMPSRETQYANNQLCILFVKALVACYLEVFCFFCCSYYPSQSYNTTVVSDSNACDYKHTVAYTYSTSSTW